MLSRTLGTLGAFAALATLAAAQPQTYGGRSETIRVGTLLTLSQVQGGLGLESNPVPHVWWNLQAQRGPVPGSWRFENPSGPGTMTPGIRNRWANLPGGGAGIPAIGARIAKQDAPYWEVSLDGASQAELSNYDVLLLPVVSTLQLTPREREKLRRFVDKGGVLWIDVLADATPSVDVLNGPPIPFELANVGAGLQIDLGHPLMRSPNGLSPQDIVLLQGGSGLTISPTSVTGEALATLASTSRRWRPVVGQSFTRQTVGVAHLGEGFVVATTRGISQILNRSVGGGANTSYRAGDPANDAASIAAAKLAVNIVSLPSSSAGVGAGSRGNSSVPVGISAPLINQFRVDSGVSTFGRTPVLYKGLLVVSGPNGIRVYDAKNARDLDGDGNTDDGVFDNIPGADLIWSNSSGNFSSATVTEVVDLDADTIEDLVLVTDSSGALLAFNLQTGAPKSPVSAPSGAEPNSNQAPTVHENFAYMVDASNNKGRLWVADLRTMQAVNTSASPWNVANAGRFNRPSAAATIGYIPILDNSGGVDLVAYVPMLPAGSNNPAGIVSIWLGSRGEAPINISQNGNQLTVTLRAALNNLPVVIDETDSPAGLRISVIDPRDGGPLTPSFSAVSQAGNGVLNLTLSGSLAGRDFDPLSPGYDAALRVDYSIDLGVSSVQDESYVRGDLVLPDQNSNSRVIHGQVAMADNGNLFVVTGPSLSGPQDWEALNDTVGGSLFCLQEAGRGEFVLKYRWDLHEALNIPVNNQGGTGNRIVWEPAINDYDGTTELPGFVGTLLNQRARALNFASGPAVKDGLVYVTATFGKQGLLGGAGRPISSALLAFDADPPVAEFTVDGLTDNSFTLLQFDPARSNNKTAPEQISAFQPGQFTFEPLSNGEGGKVRIESMMTVRRGRVRDSFANNLPVVIRKAGSPDIVVVPEAAESDAYVPGLSGGKFDPLEWYAVFNGFISTTSPVVAGDTLFMGGGSSFVSLIESGDPTQTRGLVYALDATVSPQLLTTPTSKKSYMAADSEVRPWQRYLNILSLSGPVPQQNPAILQPQAYGVNSFDDFVVRLRQTAIEDSTIAALAAGEGSVVGYGSSQDVFSFSRADFWIADQGRIGRYDSNGNPLWSATATQISGTQGPVSRASNTLPLSTPNRIYPSAEQDVWIADTGNNRVVQLDAAGRELRTIEGFKVDPNFAPEGYTPSSNTRLRLPMDLATYTRIVPSGDNPFTNAQPAEFWRHTIIADAGNARIVELVDRYVYNSALGRIEQVISYIDGGGEAQRALGVLYWHSPSELSGKQYFYNSIDRIFLASGTESIPIYAFGFGNLEPSQASFGLDSPGNPPGVDTASGTGGVVLYDPLSQPGNSRTLVINEFAMPSIGPNLFWSDAAGAFNSPAEPGGLRKISGLKSVTLAGRSMSDLRVMITDSTGLYELRYDGTGWGATFAIPNEVFRVIRRDGANVPTGANPREFSAMFARRLESGEVLVVNGYFGRDRAGNAFGGEVVLLNTSTFNFSAVNFGLNSLSVRFEMPPLVGTRGLVTPTFADKR